MSLQVISGGGDREGENILKLYYVRSINLSASYLVSGYKTLRARDLITRFTYGGNGSIFPPKVAKS